MKKILAALAMALLAACTSTAPKSLSGDIPPPPPAAKVLIVQPDVQLAQLNAGGTTEPKAEWTSAAQTNLAKAFSDHLSARSFAVATYDPDSAEGRSGQLIKLHSAVGASIMTFSYSPITLPTHPKSEFKWTLGPGTKEIADATDAHYALFVTANGTYASAGRVAASVGFAILGVGIPLGQQQMYASLVDLRSGDVIWFNVAVAGSGSDMRTDAGAKSLIASLMKKSPL